MIPSPAGGDSGDSGCFIKNTLLVPYRAKVCHKKQENLFAQLQAPFIIGALQLLASLVIFSRKAAKPPRVIK